MISITISLISTGTSTFCSMQVAHTIPYCQSYHHTDPAFSSQLPITEPDTDPATQEESVSSKSELYGFSPLPGYLYIVEKDLLRSIRDFGSIMPKATVQSSLAVNAIRDLRQQSEEVGREVENFTRELKSETDTAAGVKRAAEHMATSLDKLQKHATVSLARLKTLIHLSDESLEQLSGEAELRRSDEKEQTCKRHLDAIEAMLSCHLEISDYLAQASHGLGSIQADIEALKAKSELLVLQDLPFHEMQDQWAGLITLRSLLLVKWAGDMDYLGDASVAALKAVGARAYATIVELQGTDE
ncbi:hypothetical protein F5146DRAFT_1000314 [Armillaria mellea]|nr:hypothetical protein F5146DRAFT_1000314 [Armillaria mellea]